jgi:hypothetical protein
MTALAAVDDVGIGLDGRRRRSRDVGLDGLQLGAEAIAR